MRPASRFLTITLLAIVGLALAGCQPDRQQPASSDTPNAGTAGGNGSFGTDPVSPGAHSGSNEPTTQPGVDSTR